MICKPEVTVLLYHRRRKPALGYPILLRQGGLSLKLSRPFLTNWRCKISYGLSQIVGHHQNKWCHKTDFNNFSNLLCSMHPLILHNQEFLKASCLTQNYMSSPFCPTKQSRSFLVVYRQVSMKGYIAFFTYTVPCRWHRMSCWVFFINFHILFRFYTFRKTLFMNFLYR